MENELLFTDFKPVNFDLVKRNKLIELLKEFGVTQKALNEKYDIKIV